MKVSLCGRYPCRRACQRVCHCEAGLYRSRDLAGMLRNRRLVLRQGLHPQGGLPPERWSEVELAPPGVDPETGEFTGYHHRLSQAKEAFLYNLFGKKNYPQSQRPVSFGGRALAPYASWAILAGFLIFMGIVIGLGLAFNDGDFCPGYEPPTTPAYYEWR